MRFTRPPAFDSRARRLGRWLIRATLAAGALAIVAAWLLPVSWAYWPRLEAVPGFRAQVAPARDAFYRLEDPFRRLFDGASVPDTLPVLRFTLPDSTRTRWLAGLDSIRARGIQVGGARRWFGAELRAGTEAGAANEANAAAAPALTAKLAWHGKHFRHWASRQRSLKVKLSGPGAAWWGMKSFTLITPDNRDGSALLLAAHLAQAAGIWHPRERVVRVEVNGADWGLYYAEEPIDEDFLARRGLSSGALLAPRAAWADDFPDHRRAAAYGQNVGFNRAAHVHALNLEPAFQEIEAPTDSLAAVARGQWARLRDMVEAAATDPAHPPDSATVAALFDIPAWAAADALRHLLADRHNLTGDNLHVAYDPATSRFRPIYRYEGGLNPIRRQRGLTNAATLSYLGAPLPLWRFVNQHPTLRLAKLRALHRLTATPAPVETAINAAAPAAALLARAPGSQFPIRQRRWLEAEMRAALRHNRALIHRSLTEDMWLYGTTQAVAGRLRFELIAEGEGAIIVDIPGARPRLLLAGISPVGDGGELGLVPRRDTLSYPPLSGGELRVRNALSGEGLPKGRVWGMAGALPFYVKGYANPR